MANTGKKLFEIPIGATNGSVVGTEVKPKIYLITFNSPPDNRLLTSFCQAVILAFDIIQTKYPPGVVITTSGIGKFYSNGLDLDHATWTRAFIPDSLYALFRRVLAFPMPTVALLNGHAFAGALMLAMMHDYRIMNPHKGYLCLNEVELGAYLRPPMVSIFKEKISGATLRTMILEAKRYKALEALKEGLVDWVGGLDEALAHVEEFKLVQKAQPGMSGKSVFGELKREMWKETLAVLDGYGDEHAMRYRVAQEQKSEKAEAAKKVSAFESAPKSKL